jgi:haloalkane dehalogenase
MIPVLSDVGRVIVPDAIGFGRSDKSDERTFYTIDRHYEALVAFIETLDLTDVTLVGQDWGGILGLTAAANNPGRFHRLVPMNTGLPDGSTGMPDIWHQFRKFVESVDDLRIGDLVNNGCVTELSDPVKAAYDAPFQSEAVKAGARTWPGLVPTSPEDPGADLIGDARERLTSWDKPAFVLFSDADPITGPARDDLRGLIPTAAEQPDTWIEGAGHFLQEDAGEAVAEEIVAFIDRT